MITNLAEGILSNFRTLGVYRSVDVLDCMENVDDAGTYSVTANVITVISTEGTVMATITTLTATELVFSGMQDLDGDGTQEQVTNTFDRL